MKHWAPDQEAQLQRLMQAKEQAASLLRTEVNEVAAAMVAAYGYHDDAGSGIAGAHLPAALLASADALVAVLAPQQKAVSLKAVRSKLPVGVIRWGKKFKARAMINNTQEYSEKTYMSADDAHQEYIRMRTDSPKRVPNNWGKKKAA